MDGVDVGSLNLTSTNLITQSGVDTGAGTASVVVAGTTQLTLSSATGSILLRRSSSNPPGTVNDGSLMDNDFAGTFTVIGVDTDLRWRNVSNTADVGVIPTNIRDLEIDFPNANIDLAARTINLTGNLGLYSGLSVFDGGSVVTVAGNSLVTAGNQITLANVAGEQFNVTGDASFSGINGVTVGSQGIANFGTLEFDSNGSVTIQEDSSTVLASSSTANSLNLTSSGAITDLSAASLVVTNGATLNATSDITLNEEIGNTLSIGALAYLNAGTSISIGSAGAANFGTLRFTSVNATTIQEDSNTDLSGASSADTLDLTSAGYIQDNNNATIDITNNATFDAATTITLNEDASNDLDVGGRAYFLATNGIAVGSDGTANFGSLQFSSTGNVSIYEDSDMFLVNNSNAGSLLLNATGSITDDVGVSLVVSTTADFVATSLIALADQVGDVLTVTGSAFFDAGSTIAVGVLGSANFGSVGLLTPSSATVVESSSTHLDGVDVGSLNLTSTNLITQSGVDTGAGTAYVVVAGTTQLTLSSATGSILLRRSSSNPPGTVNDGSLMDNDFAGAFTVTGVDTDLRWRNVSNTADVGVIPTNMRDLEIDFPNANIDLAARTINLTGNLGLYSGLSVFDGGSVVTVAGNSLVTAGNQITLANVAGEQFNVTGHASFGGTNGVTVGDLGAANFGTLEFDSNGAVTIQEDSSTALAFASTANALTLTSSGAISDLSTATVGVTNGATFNATDDITLNDAVGNNLSVGGLAYFNAGTNIAVGSDGTANFGTLRFTSINGTTIQEDSDTDLSDVSSAASLDLTSSGYIQDNNNATVNVNNDASFNAGTNISLNEDGTNSLSVGGLAYFNAGTSIAVGSNGTANFGTLRFTSITGTSIQEDSNTDLSGVSAAASLDLSSAGYIRDNNGTTINIGGAATLNATTSIDLNEDVTNSLQVAGLAYFNAGTSIAVGSDGSANFGSLRFTSVDSTTIQEDSDTDLSGASSANSVVLTSAGYIGDNTNATVNIVNDATFNAATSIDLNEEASNALTVGGLAYFNAGTSIGVGSLGTANFGTLRFTSIAGTTIQEDSNTDLSGDSTALSLNLSSAGYIGDNNNATVNVTNSATFNAANSIDLDEDASNTLTVGGLAFFNAGSSIAVGSAGTANFGSLRFVSVNGTTIQEDSNTVLDDASSADSLSLTSVGSIADNDDATINITNDATFNAGTSIDLNEVGTNSLAVGGLAYFNAGTSIGIGVDGTANFGSLRFTSALGTVIDEDSSTNLSGDSSAQSLMLTSSGTISDSTTATITIANDATFDADVNVSLNEEASNLLSVGGLAYFNAGSAISVGSAGSADFGSLRFVSVAGTAIQEDSNTDLAGASSAGSLDLTSAGYIGDNLNATVNITNNAIFDAATSITLADAATNNLFVGGLAYFNAGTTIGIGPAGDANFGTLRFTSVDGTVIDEDSGTDLAGSSSASSLVLTSAGYIHDDAAATVDIANEATFNATTDITLGESAGNDLTVGALAYFNAGTTITVGSDGTANFGTLQFTAGGNASIQEDSNTNLSGTSTALSLTLTSTGAIADENNATIDIANAATFNANGSIELNDAVTNDLIVGGHASFNAGANVSIGPAGTATFGTLQFTAVTDAAIYEDDDTNLSLASAAASLVLFSAGSINDQADATVVIATAADFLATTTITLNDAAGNVLNVGALAYFEAATDITVGSAGTATFGTLQFIGGLAAADVVTIQEDDGTDLVNGSVAGTLLLSSSAYIHDHSSVTVDVTAGASFTAGTDILLNEALTNRLDIGGLASFAAGTNITVGSDGLANFGSLQFNSLSNTYIQEDSDTDLAFSSTANFVTLLSAGHIADNANSSVDIAVDGYFQAATSIDIADNAGDSWTIDGLAKFVAPLSIQIGPAGMVTFGSVSLVTDNNAFVQEDDDSLWQEIIATNIEYLSAGYIRNLVENNVKVANLATLVAEKFIHLGLVEIAKVDVTANAVGELDFTQTSTSTPSSPQYLFQLSNVADAKGVSFLTDLPSFAGTSDFFLGASSSQLLNEYSFQQNLGRSYGVFITNSVELEVQGIETQDPAVPGDLETDRPNIYVQTLTGDINVTGSIKTQSSNVENGAIVLVAGEQLNIQPGGELVTEQVADASAMQRVLYDFLTANAYSYDELGGPLITTKFLFPNNYPYIASPLASKFHTIAMSFGGTGEIGFQFVVQYGDASADWNLGVVRTFADTGDVAASNLIVAGGSKPIVAHVESLGRVATFVRNASTESEQYYYSASYLTQNPLVNSTVILRRSTDFYLFGNGGTADLATVVDTTVAEDNSQSLSGTVEPPGMPLPIDIQPFLYVEPPPAEIAPFEATFTAQNVDYDEPRPILQGEVEVAIFQVNFDDNNENGQVDEGEEPTADQILDEKQKRIIAESKDVKGPVAPTQTQIRKWQTEYEEDPTKTAGAYAVIGTDRIRGQVVFGTFILRDTANEANDSEKDVELKPNNPQPEDGAAMDVVPSDWMNSFKEIWSQEYVQAGSLWLQSIVEGEISTKSNANNSEVSQLDGETGDNSEASAAAIAAGSVLWLNRFRARKDQVANTTDYSQDARRRRNALR
ncbi:MAG: hypothetical protein J0M26_16580 [Planctomycetes bacterium]|nr:hypothetical protein [Planctomycetota bacterium]